MSVIFHLQGPWLTEWSTQAPGPHRAADYAEERKTDLVAYSGNSS